MTSTQKNDMNLYQHALDDIKRRKLIRSLAHTKHHRPDHCNVNTDIALVTETKNGAWVAAQVWVSFEGTELDKRRARLSQAEFVDGVGCECPMCGLGNINYKGIPEIDGGFVYNDAKCDDCGATWSDMYQLAGYAELKLADGTYIPIPQEPNP